MATQPETPTYPAGVYELAVTDQGKGGPIADGGDLNKPLLDLASRTAYLKQEADSADPGALIAALSLLI
jgi:hypothetical protein